MIGSRPRRFSTARWVWIPAMVALAMAAICIGEVGLTPQPGGVVGPRQCSECHEHAMRVWRRTHHYKRARRLPRDEEAQRIAGAMGIRRLKSDQRCATCHYTVQQDEDQKLRSIAEVSCESCHGPAENWIKPHADFGGAEVTRAAETPQHREQRLATCDAGGMNRPDRLYRLVSACYQCHLVADEQVVNVGGHPVAADFEMVSWSQGEVRHNFVRSQDASNVPSNAPRQRVMYVMGQAVQLEHALRALAAASGPGPYVQSMVAHVEKTIENLDRVAAAVAVDEVNEMLASARAVTLAPEQADALKSAADKIGDAARRFEASHNGAHLEDLDALVPSPESCRGTVTP